MEFKKAMAIMQMMCNNVERNCNECPLSLDWKCSVRPWADSDVVRVESILEKWEKTHPELQCPTWGKWLAENRIILTDTIPADIAERLGIEPKEK